MHFGNFKYLCLMDHAISFWCNLIWQWLWLWVGRPASSEEKSSMLPILAHNPHTSAQRVSHMCTFHSETPLPGSECLVCLSAGGDAWSAAACWITVRFGASSSPCCKSRHWSVPGSKVGNFVDREREMFAVLHFACSSPSTYPKSSKIFYSNLREITLQLMRWIYS